MSDAFNDLVSEEDRPVDDAFLNLTDTDTIVIPPRRRGRPPGSKNKEPSTRTRKDPNVERKAKEAEYQKFIVQEFNEYIMSILVSVGVPSNYIYKPGMIPEVSTVSSAYSELGNAIAIKPMQAKAIAAFAVAVEKTEIGTKATTTYVEGKAGLAIKGVMALAATGMYLAQINKVMQQLMPFLQAQKQAKQEGDKRVEDNDSDS